ncbi:MAG: tetratricopeptide repeat protein [Alphaproteobacteria bacterium]|nr:tetratricopeptide repeat protein [Alphaproteobacteria bacterium]
MNRAEKRRQRKKTEKAAKNSKPVQSASSSPEQRKPTIQQTIDLARRHHGAGRLPEAESIYRQILEACPNQPVALHMLGVMAHQVKNDDRAVDLITKAVTIKPDYTLAHFNLGIVLGELGRLDEAVASYRTALTIKPDYAEVHSNLGIALVVLGRLDEAVASFRTALAIEPDYVEAHSNLGIALMKLRRLDDAVASFHEALLIKPDFAMAHSNLGLALGELGQLDEAVASHRKALAIEPDYAEAHNNLGIALGELGQSEEAVASHRKALAIKPDYAEAHKNLGLLQLLMGDLQNGWRNYEWRWREPAARPRPFAHPPWEGQDLAGRSILVWGEQGVGDQIMLASVLPEVVEAAAHCTIECEHRLVPLFERSFAGAHVVRATTPPDPATAVAGIDFQCTLGGLPRWLRRTGDSFAAPKPYLAADPAASAAIRARYDRRGPAPKIGIAWRSITPRWGNIKTSPLAHWDPILSQGGVEFVNLQYGDCAADLAQIERRLGVTVIDDTTIDQMASVDDFAAQIDALDLVVSISNSTVHVAGALGKPVWTMLPYAPDWRWQLGRSDTLWYPNMRLIRQPRFGDWESVFAQVAADLAAWRAARP